MFTREYPLVLSGQVLFWSCPGKGGTLDRTGPGFISPNPRQDQAIPPPQTGPAVPPAPDITVASGMPLSVTQEEYLVYLWFCREYFNFNDDLTVEGLLGITLDNSTIVLINISEAVNKDDDRVCDLTKHVKEEACSVEEDDDDIDLEMSVENTSLQDDNSSPENTCKSHPRRKTRRNVVSNDSGRNQTMRKTRQVDANVTQADSVRDVEGESEVKTQGIHTFDCRNKSQTSAYQPFQNAHGRL